MTPDEARAALDQALIDIVPDAAPESLADDEDIRRALELDSLDFVELVERLSQAIGARIEEDDYPQMRTVRTAVPFLVGRAAPVP